uniref:Cytosolic fatty-acid binding proteins domain-containing protein n=1 Tax=Ciona savignyi TaxID=51511 RepID=H2YB02_CIOSA
MDFAGTWILTEQKGYEDFMKLMGVPEQYIAAGKNAPVSLVIDCDGQKFAVTTTTGTKSWTDNFEVGKPAQICGPGQRQLDTVVNLVDGKLTGEYEMGPVKMLACRELVDGQLHDILSLGTTTFRRIFARQ